MQTTMNATNSECTSDGSLTAPVRTGRRTGRWFLACLAMACLAAGTAFAANKDITMFTKVDNAGPKGKEVVEAIKSGNISALDAILEREEWDIDAPINLGRKPDLSASVLSLWPFGDGYYAPAPHVLYGTPLMYAARLGRVRIVQHLLELGANPNVMIQTGGVNLEDAGQGLIGIKRPYICALTDAYMFGKNHDLGKLLKGKTFERADQIGQMLIEAGAVLPPEDVWGRNALWDAAIARSPRLFNLCLQSGLDPDEEDNVGHTVMDDIDATLESSNKDPDFRESLFNFKRALAKSASSREEQE